MRPVKIFAPGNGRFRRQLRTYLANKYCTYTYCILYNTAHLCNPSRAIGTN